MPTLVFYGKIKNTVPDLEQSNDAWLWRRTWKGRKEMNLQKLGRERSPEYFWLLWYKWWMNNRSYRGEHVCLKAASAGVQLLRKLAFYMQFYFKNKLSNTFPFSYWWMVSYNRIMFLWNLDYVIFIFLGYNMWRQGNPVPLDNRGHWNCSAFVLFAILFFCASFKYVWWGMGFGGVFLGLFWGYILLRHVLWLHNPSPGMWDFSLFLPLCAAVTFCSYQFGKKSRAVL